jgi:hypothetical protein
MTIPPDDIKAIPIAVPVKGDAISAFGPPRYLIHPAIRSLSGEKRTSRDAYAKANPDKLNMGTGGPGSGQHVYGELFKVMAGVDLVTVHYRGAGLASYARKLVTV